VEEGINIRRHGAKVVKSLNKIHEEFYKKMKEGIFVLGGQNLKKNIKQNPLSIREMRV